MGRVVEGSGGCVFGAGVILGRDPTFLGDGEVRWDWDVEPAVDGCGDGVEVLFIDVWNSGPCIPTKIKQE